LPKDREVIELALFSGGICRAVDAAASNLTLYRQSGKSVLTSSLEVSRVWLLMVIVVAAWAAHAYDSRDSRVRLSAAGSPFLSFLLVERIISSSFLIWYFKGIGH
jgi:hypothetical protein